MTSNPQPSRPETENTIDNTTFQTIQAAVFKLWDAVNQLTRIEPPRRERYCVTVFGSARLTPDTPLYNSVKHLASELTALGCDIVTGGGPGLMQAANEGSVIADPDDRTQSIGIRVALDFEQETNPFVEQAYCHETFFSRLHHFVLVSDAFVVVPGGIGTTLEMLTIWQLLQVRQLQHKPLILFGNMWKDLIDWAETHMVETEVPMADATDLAIPHCVDCVEDAVVLLRQAQAQWSLSCCPKTD